MKRLLILLLLVSVMFFLLLTLFSSQSVLAATGSINNATLEKDAIDCINESKDIINEMNVGGFKIQRVNDTLKQAELTYQSQIALKEKKKNYDFSSIINSCENIKEIQELAIIARDELEALDKFYSISVVEGMDTTSIDQIIEEVNTEIDNERYEGVAEVVDKAYSEISRVKSSYTAANVIYRNTAKSLKIFWERNWKVIIALTITLIIFYIIYRIRILKWMINRKVERLRTRRKTIKELIMQTQKDYFQYGRIPEGEYNIKTKKFSELIRDIDRQIPLLQEDLIKLDKKTKLVGLKAKEKVATSK